MEILLSKLYYILEGLSDCDKEFWAKKLNNIYDNSCSISPNDIGAWILYIILKSENRFNIDKLNVIGYGAGNMAEAYGYKINEYITIQYYMDAYSDKKKVNGIEVKRPCKNQKNNSVVIVFIDDESIRNKAKKTLSELGYDDVFYFRDVLNICGFCSKIEDEGYIITDQGLEIIKTIQERYYKVNSNYPPVFFDVYDIQIGQKEVEKDSYRLNGSELVKNLWEKLIFKGISYDYLAERTDYYLKNENIHGKTVLKLLCNIELFVREILHEGVKTKYRPLRMVDDYPYDTFAVTEVLTDIVDNIRKNNNTFALEIINLLINISKDNIPVIAVKIKYLLTNEKYEEALEEARRALYISPNSLLANECFYLTAVECKKNKIYVEEPIPEYNLGNHFCWSGISFAWCGGIDYSRNKTFLSPCFRPLQCAARPDGMFWEGDEWKEFRKSITDGSFRYCQKNQCPNIVAGWLPNKSDIDNPNIIRLLNGDTNIVPELEELHLSYDDHCNLKCPSCRLSFKTSSKEEVKKYDRFYETELKPFVKKVKHLCLSGCGEAMISPHSRNILMSLSPEEYPELEIELRTNMTSLNKKNWEALGEGRKCIKHIAASIDSCTKSKFEIIRYPAKWDIVIENLKYVKELRQSNQIEMLEFHVVVQKENINELYDIVKFAIENDADCITFSKMINWRNMPKEEYRLLNPFWYDNEYHTELNNQIAKIINLRESIENGTCSFVNKKVYINMHFVPDPNDTYKEIRNGRIRIR